MYIPNPFTGAEIASGMEMNIDFELEGLCELNQCGIHLHVDEPKAVMDSEYSLDMVSAKRPDQAMIRLVTKTAIKD